MRMKRQLLWQAGDDFRMWVTPAFCGWVGITAVAWKVDSESTALKNLGENFLLGISLVNGTKSPENCGFSHIY